MYASDLKQLKKYVKACILCGSILTRGEKAKDVDVLVIIQKRNFKKVEQKKTELSKFATKPVHFIYQTQKDFRENIKKKDEPILHIIKKGAVLWGHNIILECIKDAD